MSGKPPGRQKSRKKTGSVAGRTRDSGPISTYGEKQASAAEGKKNAGTRMLLLEKERNSNPPWT